eukprot:jgi/Tetstr1/448186/TSEL_035477.t1
MSWRAGATACRALLRSCAAETALAVGPATAAGGGQAARWAGAGAPRRAFSEVPRRAVPAAPSPAAFVPAAQVLARVAATPAATSALVVAAGRWLQYAGVGTLATGAGLMAESARRSNLPEVCSSHGREGTVSSLLPMDKVARALRLLGRGTFLTLLFAPAALLGLCVYLTGSQHLKRLWYGLLSASLEHGGAAFIKWGQWASTRTDLFPVELCEALSKLHSGAPCHAFRHTEAIIEAELGLPVDEIFEYFERAPVASGSVAQVYRAAYRGQPVAVKVRHPGVEQQIRDDFVLLGAVAAFLSRFESLAWMNLESSLGQFSTTMADQVMLDAEARHLTRFLHLFWGRSGVSFPVPVYPLVTPAVLVESFEFASSVTASINADMNNHVRKYVVRQGTQIYLQMLLADNFMHADLHPGNILLRYTEAGIPQLVLVDAGMVAQLDREEQDNFIGLFQAFGSGDGDKAAHHILRFAERQTCSDVAGFSQDMQVLFEEACRGYHTGVDIGEVVRGCLDVVRTHHVRMDANYVTLLVNVLCIEGLGRQMMPEYNILDSAKPMLEAHRMLGTDALSTLMPLYSLYSAVVDRVLWWEYKLEEWATGGSALA